jgi:hypothetical protein
MSSSNRRKWRASFAAVQMIGAALMFFSVQIEPSPFVSFGTTTGGLRRAAMITVDAPNLVTLGFWLAMLATLAQGIDALIDD